jgi:hypothetical protein
MTVSLPRLDPEVLSEGWSEDYLGFEDDGDLWWGGFEEDYEWEPG